MRLEKSRGEISGWFENVFEPGIGEYVSEVEKPSSQEYHVTVNNGSTASLKYDMREHDTYIDVGVSVSGGELAVDSALTAFNQLWTRSTI